MKAIELRALRGNKPLGFLAALGTVWLAGRHLGQQCELGWPEGPANSAVITVDGVDSVDELAELLRGAAVAMRDSQALVPGLDGFPPRKEGSSGTDPVRDLDMADGRRYAETALGHRSEPWSEWVAAVVSTAPVGRESGEPLTPSTTLVWPTGQVTLDRTLRAFVAIAAEEGTILGALSRWKRSHSTGAYLDHCAVQDEGSIQQLKGNVPFRSEPGATWLALMAMPWFPMRADTDERPPCWCPRRGHAPTRFSWPVWTGLLDPDSISVILEHPALDGRDDTALTALGIAATYEAERRPGHKSEGPVGAAKRVWPSE